MLQNAALRTYSKRVPVGNKSSMYSGHFVHDLQESDVNVPPLIARTRYRLQWSDDIRNDRLRIASVEETTRLNRLHSFRYE